MANRDSTINLSFKMSDDGSINAVIKNVDGLKKAMTSSIEAADKMHKSIVNWGMAAQAAQALGSVINQMQGAMTKLTGLYDAQASAETKLAAVMRNTMGASDDEIQSIKDLTSAQQALGVIGDEVQLAGAQKLAGFAREKASLETLIPVLNDMVAQQYGFKATQEGAATVAGMLGKVLSGQVGALNEYGYSFSAAQQEVLKYGTEAQKVAVISEVVSAKVGGVNAALAQTDAGRAQQAANAMGDFGEKVGKVLTPVKTVVGYVALFGQAATGITAMTSSVKTLALAIGGLIRKQELSVAWDKTKIALTKSFTAVQTALNVVLRSNPFGIVVTAVAALVTTMTVLYRNCESFREWVDSAWSWIKSFSSGLVDVLAKAWDKVSSAISKCWGWIKTILGISGDAPKTYESEAESVRVLTDAYETNTKAVQSNASAKSAAAQGSLAAANAEVSALKTLLENASPSERPAIAARLVLAEKAAEDLQSLIDHEKFTATVDFKPSTIEGGAGLGPLLPTAEKADPLTAYTPEAKSWSDMYREAVNAATEANFGFIESSKAIGNTFNSLGKVVKGAAADWMNWGASVMNAIAAAIPQIAALTAMQKGQASANAEAGVTGAVSSVSSIPIVGPAMAVAAAASVIAAMASIPKFAVGGIAYGPTLGMFGEYAGASSNPEVVAPLDRLRSLISPAGGVSGKVEFEIDGRVLRGVLRKVDALSSRG